MLAAGAACAPAQTLPPPKAAFQAEASSDGWVDFRPDTSFGVFLPARINGRDAMVGLYTGLSSRIDEHFAAEVGLKRKSSGADSPIDGVDIKMGALTLKDMQAHSAADIPARLTVAAGGPVVMQLGDEVFDQVAVDIDFPHHRVAFRDPETLTPPPGAEVLPLIATGSDRTAPLSIEGAAPGQFALWLGNTGYLLVYQKYYEDHRLIEGRPTSNRLMPGGVEQVATVRHVLFGGVDFPAVPAALVPDSVSKVDSAVLSGGLGLPLLSAFRVIIDYPHNRLYLIPATGAADIPFRKDRLGLVLAKTDAGYGVTFVSSNSPAEAAGFRVGDDVVLINGKPPQEWPVLTLTNLRFADAGATYTFTLKGGVVKQLKAADFY